ncbi:MAG TPA: TadE family protein [Terriglobales bacterium]|nr:TadE family protein [Terriglobales bacterium]
MRVLARLRRETAASQIAEAALVLPIVFTLLLGIYWVGRAMNVYATINQAARQGARAAVTASCATCGNQPLGVDQVADQVRVALQASRLDPNLVVPNIGASYAACSGGAASCVQPTTGPNVPQICYFYNVQLNQPISGPPTGPPACGVVVTFQYPYPLNLPLGSQQIPLTAQIQMEGEN